MEAGGRGTALGQHAATLCAGRPGVLHGSSDLRLQDEDGQTADVHSRQRRPGLSRRRPRACLLERHRAGGICQHHRCRGAGGVSNCRQSWKESCPALESAHAIAHAAKLAPKLGKDQIVVINLSGRGDKDCQEVARLIEMRD